jgi:hypothetical protein
MDLQLGGKGKVKESDIDRDIWELGLSISQPLTDLVKEVAIVARRRDANMYSLINLGFNPTIWHFCFFFKKSNPKKRNHKL